VDLTEKTKLGVLDIDFEEKLFELTNSGEGQHWDTWNRVGMICNYKYRGNDSGLQYFITWSKQSDKYDEKKTCDAHKNFKSDHKNPIAYPTLVMYVNQEKEQNAKKEDTFRFAVRRIEKFR